MLLFRKERNAPGTELGDWSWPEAGDWVFPERQCSKGGHQHSRSHLIHFTSQKKPKLQRKLSSSYHGGKKQTSFWKNSYFLPPTQASQSTSDKMMTWYHEKFFLKVTPHPQDTLRTGSCSPKCQEAVCPHGCLEPSQSLPCWGWLKWLHFFMLLFLLWWHKTWEAVRLIGAIFSTSY